MSNFRKVLTHLRKISHNNTDQGKLFEKTMKRYFLTDNLYTSRFSKVWLWNEWPGRKSGDIGIDLVAKEMNGNLCAIQCKFFAKDSTINKKDIDSFLEASTRYQFQSRILVYTGGTFGKNVGDALSGHNCTVLSFDSLVNRPLDWSILADGIIQLKKQEPYKPRNHQQYAINKVIAGFEKNN